MERKITTVVFKRTGAYNMLHPLGMDDFPEEAVNSKSDNSVHGKTVKNVQNLFGNEIFDHRRPHPYCQVTGPGLNNTKSL